MLGVAHENTHSRRQEFRVSVHQIQGNDIPAVIPCIIFQSSIRSHASARILREEPATKEAEYQSVPAWYLHRTIPCQAYDEAGRESKSHSAEEMAAVAVNS